MSKSAERPKRKFRFLQFGLMLMIVLEIMLLIAFVFHDKNFAVFNPKGFIAGQQSGLILLSAGIMFAVAIPTLFILYLFAWKYRETNHKAAHDPLVTSGKSFVFTIWAIPTVVMLVMVLIMIPATHRLDPRQHITSDNEPITIQVVAMRWKWVFLYPEQHIATVNYVQIPTNTPIRFELTADESPMSSFWIPNLGGQMYAMTGHVNTLQLMATEPGDYPGSSAELTGAGFAGMKFVARASTNAEYYQWLDDIKRMPNALDAAEYNALLKPSENNEVAYYSKTDSDLFSTMVSKYNGSHGGHDDSSHAHTEHE